MSNFLLIDGVDISTRFNVSLADGCYMGLVGWPEMKSVKGNDWQEQDGYEPDLSNPLLESRTVTLKFNLHGTVSEIDSFYAFLGATPTRYYNFSDLGRAMTLRLESMPSITYARTFHIIQVQLAADTPLENLASATPSSTMRENSEYVIDGRAISDYGVRVLQGTISSVIKGADVKPLLIRKSSVINGAKYDENPLLNDADGSFSPQDYETIGGSFEGVSANWKRSKSRGTVTYKGRDITLRCHMEGAKAAVWRNYDALLYNLTKNGQSVADPTLSGARTISIRALGKTFKCFYKRQEVTEFYCADGLVWIKFDLSLTLFQEEGDSSFFLATEDDGFVITEDGKLIPVVPAY